ncbi:MAG: DNA-3-methyladenine glycosylase 2 family protein [Fimbriimonadaceae bacterium]|nr:MAG: DNA-3-methyladenine glycosylase 2 family protein [Fimbriimonadaceae bacterium]
MSLAMTDADLNSAIDTLRNCKYLGSTVAAFDAPKLEPTSNPFRSLVRIITFQQLSGKAAETIYNRFAVLVGADDELAPEHLLSHDIESLRTVGLSRQKASYILNIAHSFHDLNLTTERLLSLPDDEVRAALINIKGVGHWTVDMFLMFYLCRPNIFPTGDLGIQNAIRPMIGKEKFKAPEMEAFAEQWQPYRTVAAYYLWRTLDSPTQTPE